MTSSTSRHHAAFILIAMTAAACGPGTLFTPSSLPPWTGPTVAVTEPEGNTLTPNTAYTGTWTNTTYFTFDFEVTSMVAMQVTAKDDMGKADSLDLKLFQDYVELYSTVSLSPHDGEYGLRLPPGKYNLSLQLLPGIDAAAASGWNLRVKGMEGADALKVHVPEKILRKLQAYFKGNVLNLPGVLGENPSFMDLLDAWLLISAPTYASYVKPGTLLHRPDEDLVNIFDGTAGGFELFDHEPVLVYELVDLYAARIVTTDGLYGIVHIDSFVEGAVDDPRLPDTFRVAEGYRMLHPDSDPPARNGGDLVVLQKVKEKKDMKKTRKCLAEIHNAIEEQGVDMEGLRLQIMAMAPGDPGYGDLHDQYVQVRDWKLEKQQECLASAWETFGMFLTDKDRVVAAFDLLASIRRQFGFHMTEVPADLPPILPSLVPPPPPEPVAPPPTPPPTLVATAPPATTPPLPAPTATAPPATAPPATAPPATAPPATAPPATAPPATAPPATAPPATAPPAAPAPPPQPEWQPIIPWGWVDSQK
ncbi:MAG: hypothetical protein JRG91_03265 [Deltaproteobacteria bacterium]|nr:hypothetical protein [Deltaproteobacteria bacterium]